ncbi:MAG: large subunit ribosomal protein [Patescibacteria group bacterium]|nr:large subunit ribosomal protein [Patescibacteria group bacterium]
MARVKKNSIAMKRRRNVLKAAKGYRFQRSKTEMAAKVAIRKAGAYAFAHRKDKKTDMRRLWTVRLNAFLRENGTTYSKFIDAAAKANMMIDRKILATLAEKDPSAVIAITKELKLN